MSCATFLWVIVMAFKATFKYFSTISCGQSCWWRKPEYPEKITDLSQISDQLNVVSSTPSRERDSNSKF